MRKVVLLLCCALVVGCSVMSMEQFLNIIPIELQAEPVKGTCRTASRHDGRVVKFSCIIVATDDWNGLVTTLKKACLAAVGAEADCQAALQHFFVVE